MSLISDLNAYTPTDEPLLVDVAAISQSLDHIINSVVGTRLFRPEYPGETLNDKLFDLIDDIGAVDVYRTVTMLIHNNEPRVKILNQLSHVVPYPEEHRYDIRLVYTIVGYGDQQFRLNGSIRR